MITTDDSKKQTVTGDSVDLEALFRESDARLVRIMKNGLYFLGIISLGTIAMMGVDYLVNARTEAIVKSCKNIISVEQTIDLTQYPELRNQLEEFQQEFGCKYYLDEEAKKKESPHPKEKDDDYLISPYLFELIK